MKILKRKTLAALLAFSLLASLLPLGAQPALAAENVPGTLVVGNVTVNTSQDGYWTTDGTTGNLTESSADKSWNVHYDMSTNILYLNAATITASNNNNNNPSMVGIYASASENQPVSLNIILQGENKVSGDIGIYVYSSSNGDASLSIEGGGSLKASGSVNPGIRVQSNSSKATLTIQNAEVEATVSASGSSGVTVQADESSEASLSVDGGSLTASGRKGILFPVGTPQLTVDNSAIVRASNGIGAGNNEDSFTPDGTGIVFDGSDGTVYGDVELKENLEIGEGESLTIPQESSLTIPDGKTLTVNGGELTGNVPQSGVAYKVTDVSLNKTSLTLTEGGSETLTAIITPDNATDQTVTWSSEPNNIVSITPDENDSKKAIITATGTGITTIKATVDGKTAECSVTVNQATTTPVTSVTLDKSTLSLIEGENEQLTATVEPSNATNKAVTWSSSDSSIVTVGADQTDNTKATVKALKEGSATITATTADGNKNATCTVTVKEPPYTGKYSYEVSTSVGDHGSLTVDRYATEGDEVTITVTPDEAYKLDDLSVTAGGKEVALTAGGDGTFSFTMPSADVKISATFAEDPDWTEPEEPATDVSDIFLDVAPNAWYKDAVQYAYAGGLMTGVSANEFAPEATTTRAMIVSMLARLEGVESAESAGFTDVAADDWYATAVNWAAASGITSGTGDGNFSPNTAITREQLAAILMNYAQYKGQDVSARATLDTYSDATAISSWANDVMSWAVAEGLISGVTADTLQPQGAATRAQVAAILQRFLSE